MNQDGTGLRPAKPAEAERVVAVLNAGSSSLKYEVITADGKTIAEGIVERIGQPDSCPDHAVAVERALAELEARVPELRSGLVAVGHRVVHGGPNLYQPTAIDTSVLAEIERWAPLAPLHTPIALTSIRMARLLLPGVAHVAVFDTGFHHDLPPVARTYALPWALTERWAIRRYGFHGISCAYLIERLEALDAGRRRVIVCHLGAGASVTAVSEGRSVDTSMGFTPLEGLVMATRSGDLDPAIPLYLQEHVGLTGAQVAHVLESESGFQGLGGASDFRTIEQRAAAGDSRARLAVDVFAYRVRKYVGAYWAVLGGLDALVFAGGIGEHSASLRQLVVGPLEALGLRLDASANTVGSPERRISPPDAPVAVWVIPTRESAMIARQAFACTGQGRSITP